MTNQLIPAQPDARSYTTSLLSLYGLRASLEPDVQASYQKQKYLKTVQERLVAQMNAPEGYPNKNYNGLAEAIALSIILYDYYPNAYAEMVTAIAPGDMDVFLDSYDGLHRFSVLINGLADDHDYVFSQVRNRIERSGPENHGERGLCPAEFLIRVRHAMIDGEIRQQTPSPDNDAPRI